MYKMKKILSVIISAFIVMTIFCAVPVCAADIDISVDVSFYDITVTVKSEYDNMTAILKNKANTELYGMYSSYSPTVANGVKVHTFNFKMPESGAPTGAYVVYAGNQMQEASKEFNFVTVSSKVAFYNALNDKAAGELKGFFTDDAYKYAVPVDLTAYMNLEAKQEGRIFNLVNSEIADFATGYADIAENDIATLESVDNEFKEVFSQAMEIAEVAVVDRNGWTSLAEEKIANEEFDVKYYDENATVKLTLSSVFPYYEKERARVETLDLSEYAKAFDKATLSLLSTADFGTFKTGFVYFKDKPSITVSSDDWTNISALINAGKDSTLWENIKGRAYASCDEMVADVGTEAKALIDSGILNAPAIGGGTAGGGGGGGSVDRPISPGTSGPVSGGEAVIKPVEPTLTGTFGDVEKAHWAYDAIEELADKGILNGKGDGKFAPNDGVTREEFVKIIVVAFDLTADSEITFADVEDGRWSAEFIKAAAHHGIVTGDGKNFNPTAVITRQEMAVIIHRVFEHLGIEVTGEAVSFDDNAEIADYAKAAIETLSGAGIINGMGDGTFAPKGSVTRAQSAKVVYGLLNLSGGGK